MKRVGIPPLWVLAILLAPLAFRGLAARAAGENDPRSVFWEPYRLDAASLGLYPCDFAAAASEDDADLLLEAALDGGGSAPPLLGKDDGRRLTNLNSMGPALNLLGGARQVPEGRFAGGVRLPTAAAAISGKVGSARGTTEFWMRLDALPEEAVWLLARGPAQQTPGTGVRLVPGGGLEVVVQGETLATAPQAVEPGRWHHIGLVMDWGHPNQGFAKLAVDGELVLDLSPQWDYLVANYLTRQSWLEIGGWPSHVDEIRVSRGRRAWYAHDLEWVDAQGTLERPEAPPFFRDADDLWLHLPFDQRFDATRAPDDLVVEETSLRVVGLGLTRASRGFGDGVRRDGLLLGQNMAKPRYRAPNLMRAQRGTVAFWMRPVNWDNLTWVDHRQEKEQVVRFRLFRVFGAPSPKAAERRPMRGSDPSLLAFLVDVTPNRSSGCDTVIHPGRWTHVAIAWNGGEKTMVVNGEQVANPGLHVHTHAWYARNETMDVFIESQPTELRFEGDSGDRRTLIDDFRIYRRALTAEEIRNLARLPDARAELAPLPEISATLAYNGLAGWVEVEAVPLTPDYARIARLTMALTAEDGGCLARTETRVTDPFAVARLRIEDTPLDFGRFTVALKALDETEAAVVAHDMTFTRSPPPWWRNQLGVSDRVMPPWTPVVAEGDGLKVWGRDMHFGGDGLPRRIVSQGEDVLAGPIRLEAGVGGRRIELTPAAAAKVRVASEARGEIRGELRGEGFRIRTESYMEFDGMMWFTLTIEPEPGAAPTLDRLTLEIPFRDQAAETIHWWSGQRDFRNPKHVWIGDLSIGDGVKFRSDDGETVGLVERQRGSFIPYVMLTGMARGMAWFAENDRGWTQTEGVPAVSVRREGESVALRLNCVAEPVALSEPRTIAFGLHPTPVRPLDPLWRSYPFFSNVIPDTFSGNDLKCGNRTSPFALYPLDDWDAVHRRIDGEGLTEGAAGLKGRSLARRRTLTERGVADPPPQMLAVPGLYWDMQWNMIPPSLTHTREWAETWALNYQYYTPEFVDFCSWAWNDWVEKTNAFVRGAYIDDMWGAPITREGGPCTYSLPDGHVQPGFQFLGPRERFKRMRQILHDHGIWPHLTAHTTHTYFIPYHSFFELILDGEDSYSSPPRQSDFIDHWPADRMRFMHNAKWGQVTTWLGWTGNSTPTDRFPAWTFRQNRAFEAWLSLHDIAWPFAGRIEERFRLQEPDTEFVPYWGETRLGEHAHAGLELAAWRRPGKCLVLLVNSGEERIEAEVRLDPAAMGFAETPTDAIAIEQLDPNLLSYFDEDATTVELPHASGGDPLDIMPESVAVLELEESDADLPPDERRAKDPDGRFEWREGVLRAPVRRHDYRLFLFQSANEMLPAD